MNRQLIGKVSDSGKDRGQKEKRASENEMAGQHHWCNEHGGGGGLVAKSCPILATPRTVACQAPLSMTFSRQEYWSGLPFPSPGDLPDPGIEPQSPTLKADALQSEPPGQSCKLININLETIHTSHGLQNLKLWASCLNSLILNFLISWWWWWFSC